LGFQTLEGVSDIRDESDRSGMRIVVEVYQLQAIWRLDNAFSILFVVACISTSEVLNALTAG
jgi:hypothetical protein